MTTPTRKPPQATRGEKRSRSPESEDEPPRKRPTARAVKPSSSTNTKPPTSRRSASRSRSPPRKRPGASAALSAASLERSKQRRQAREKEEADKAAALIAARGVHDVVKQHYNTVPERGREWRKTDSKIKGLRSFNNWVKSTLVQKFSPSEGDRYSGILVLDIGCGKGGDLQKWANAPQKVDLYVGADPADVSIQQARDRYREMQRRGQRNRGKLFHAEFSVKDCFGEWMGDIPIIQEVGIDSNTGPGSRGGGFDVVSMMFCMHYAFESEEKARNMLKNVAGALKKGGRFLGVIPNSDILSEKVEEHHKANSKPEDPGAPNYESEDDWDPEKSLDVPDETPAKTKATNDEEKRKEDGEVEDESLEWGNEIYRVKFPGKTPKDGVFRPPFGWKYFYFLEEAVEEVPEYVVPWEAFRALAEDYNLELQYRKPFNEIWDEEKNDPDMGPLSERMGVRERGAGRLLVREEEMNAASFYHAFCFYKV